MCAAEFVEIWNGAASSAEVTAKTGIRFPQQRASELRRKGYRLKLFQVGRPRKGSTCCP